MGPPTRDMILSFLEMPAEAIIGWDKVSAINTSGVHNVVDLGVLAIHVYQKGSMDF